MLDLGCENEDAQYPGPWKGLLQIASKRLQILDPALGEQELIKSVAAELANLGEMAGKGELKEGPEGA